MRKAFVDLLHSCYCNTQLPAATFMAIPSTTNSSLKALSTESAVHSTAGFTTPHTTTVKAVEIDKCQIKNGPHCVSLLYLKSLEPSLSKGEEYLLKLFDKNFTNGWLYDEIINSYLWKLCNVYKDCLMSIYMFKHSASCAARRKHQKMMDAV